MGFVQLIQKDLEQALAEQQRVVLVQVLRRRIATMTFAELRELLASPLGKALGSVKVAEVLAVSAETPAPSSGKAAATKGRASKAKPTKKSKPATKKPAKKARTKPIKKKPQAPAASATPAAPEAAGAAVQAPQPAGKAAKKQAKKAGKKQAKKAGKKPAKEAGAGKAASNAKSPPGMSAEQAAEMARYNAAVLALVREAGGLVTSSALHEKSGGSINQLRLALHKLVTSGEIEREGERGNTRYRATAK